MEPPSGSIRCSNGIWLPPLVCESESVRCLIIIQEPKEVYGPNSLVEYQCGNGYTTGQANDRGTITCQNGTWTEAQPCIDNCGEIPHVPNGLPEPQEQQRSLKYTCQNFYKLVGPDTVVCHRGGTWSEVPTCKDVKKSVFFFFFFAEDFCFLDTTKYSDLTNSGNTFIRNGDTEYPRCVDKWMFKRSAVVRCIDGNLTVSICKYQCLWL
uniref:Sushi domain-containing protein n=1 Tax=Xiphophorus maculatus TaxID=8083 RepID=A0A3B5QTC1_XIPMA